MIAFVALSPMRKAHWVKSGLMPIAANMTLRDKDNTHSYSTVNKIKPMALNFEINSRLSSLSWEAYDDHLSLDEIKKQISGHYQ